MKRAQKWLRIGITAILGIACIPVLNLNVEKLAERQGWDQFLSSNWAWLISAMSNIVESAAFLVVLGTALGGTLFMWVDFFIRRVDRWRTEGGETKRLLWPASIIVVGMIMFIVGTVWLYRAMDAATSDVSIAGGEAAQPSEQEQPWPETSPYDLPKKLAAIDELLEIVGSEKEYELTARKGKVFVQSWEDQIKKGTLETLIRDLKAYEQQCRTVHEKINAIRKANEKYPDIEYILTPKQSANIVPSLRGFVDALKNLRPEPPVGFKGLIQDHAKRFEGSLQDFGRWRFELEKALLARRKELSG